MPSGGWSVDDSVDDVKLLFTRYFVTVSDTLFSAKTLA